MGVCQTSPHVLCASGEKAMSVSPDVSFEGGWLSVMGQSVKRVPSWGWTPPGLALSYRFCS